MRASLRDRLVTGRTEYEATSEDSAYQRMMFGSPMPEQPAERGENGPGGGGVSATRSSLDGEE